MYVICYISLLMPPLPPLQCWLLAEDIFVKSSLTFSSAVNIAMGVGGITTRNFLQNTQCVMSFVRDCRCNKYAQIRDEMMHKFPEITNSPLEKDLTNQFIEVMSCRTLSKTNSLIMFLCKAKNLREQSPVEL